MMFEVFKTPIWYRLILLTIIESYIIIGIPLYLASHITLMAFYVSFPLAVVLSIVLGLFAIFMIYRLWLSIGFVVDLNLPVIDALKASYRATTYNLINLILLHLLYMIVFVISLIPFGLGLIWTIPLAYNLYAVSYKRLLLNYHGVIDQS